ncbi:MAG: carbamoyl-phosphate synthase large subunit, partial [Candidatus Margulisiibacteriota bacterium]
MPKRTDIKKILLIGSGPIIIGQACEFDYSGTQACAALKEEGFEIVLVNSNPATIMTDPAMADATYIEPLTIEALTKIIEKERPDAVLPTLGGQTGLNLAMGLAKAGILVKYNVEMLGATEEVIEKAEGRDLFKKAMEKIGLSLPKSIIATDLEDAKSKIAEIGFPCVVRPAFTLGGTGGGIAYNQEELEQIASSGLKSSIISEILIEESIIGWKEYELEVMRDKNDNVVIICSIENLDPMGVHTGDSITVAPAQTLTDKEYQAMRDAAIKIIREIGVETGGSNIQFAINPANGKMTVIEMNPRVSRSSALASKATGFPIAKFAAKLAVGFTLDELMNDITKKTPACFEPTIDYVVVKIPRFTFEKFPATKPHLGTVMKSVGEAMSIGRTFKESLQKGLRSLETKRFGMGFDGKDLARLSEEELKENLVIPNPERLFYIKYAFENNYSIEQLFELTKIDPWFLYQIKEIVDFGQELSSFSLILSQAATKDAGENQDRVRDEDFNELIFKAKQFGFSDFQLAKIFSQQFIHEEAFRKYRKEICRPTYKLVDTCAAEFEAFTPYYYSTYEVEDEVAVTDNEKVMILGGGPNRIGQGIEFDYCCVHASMAVREMGLESIMVNSNPETVSTDFSISDRLYFEPLTFEDVLNIYEKENEKNNLKGVIVQFGGQTPLNLAEKLEKAGVKILGTSSKSIEIAEDRKHFQKLLHQLNLKQPKNVIASSVEEAIREAKKIGYPLVVRPSFVLGGRAMEIVYDELDLINYLNSNITNFIAYFYEIPDFISKLKNKEKIETVIANYYFRECIEKKNIQFKNHHINNCLEQVSKLNLDLENKEEFFAKLNKWLETLFSLNFSNSVLLDQYLENAIEIDVDALADGQESVIAGIMEHIEEAGIHSGDSACSLPPHSLSEQNIDDVRAATKKLAKALEVKGLLNIQFAIKNNELFVLEVNPRASRTVPFVSKATGVAWAKMATKVILGKTIKELGLKEVILNYTAVKEAVFPFNRFPDVDILLGPEMKSTGEVMGIDQDFGMAYLKSQLAAGQK